MNPTAATVCYVPAEQGYRLIRRQLGPGRETMALEEELAGLRSRHVPAQPQPGGMPAHLCGPKKSAALIGEPIIAWRITREESTGRDVVTPVTVRGEPDGSRAHMAQGIVFPNGKVYAEGDQVYSDVKAFLEAIAARGRRLVRR